MTTPISIISAGLCCSVGSNIEAADCALRAGMNHFQESDFIALNGQPVRVARLPDVDHWGTERLGRWGAAAIQECLANARVPLDILKIPLLLITAERDRPTASDDYYQAIYTSLLNEFDSKFDERTRLVAAGRAGIGAALTCAQQWLNDNATEYVLVAGVDSFLDAQTIEYFLKTNRLLTYGNSDGFIPGEAAAAILLSKKKNTGSVTICGIGEAMEDGRPDGSTPSLSLGHTNAIRAAIAQSGLPMTSFSYRFSDQSGEAFFAREAANALTRVGLEGLPKLATITLADCVGDVGAATGPMALAWASKLLPRNDTLGHTALAHFANDDGLRSALVLNYN